jgi:hypothetical protein
LIKAGSPYIYLEISSLAPEFVMAEPSSPSTTCQASADRPERVKAAELWKTLLPPRR